MPMLSIFCRKCSQLFTLTAIILLLLCNMHGAAQNASLADSARAAMLRATRYMTEDVSTRGGYVWYYLPDFSRRWGEMEAYETMIWLQHPGTISVGHVLLDAYRATGEEYYYQAAQKAAAAIIWGQNHEGGWNYMIDFAGDRSLKEWYATIGKNGWRLEEFQYYYGNSTFDDDVSTDAARFLLRMYLQKMDPVYKPALFKAIDFILESQYPEGGWPQRYPLRYDFNKPGHPDYTSFYTFNDDVTWENVNFLIECYLTLGQPRFLDPIFRGMNFYLISQDPSGGWGQQLDMDMKATAARTYEPRALLPGATFENAMILLKFYTYSGDKKFLEPVPSAIRWLEQVRLPQEQTGEGRYTHSTFVDPDTQKPIYVHRKGSNVKYGFYYTDTLDSDLLGHYGGKCRIALDRLVSEYERLLALTPVEATTASPLKPGRFTHDGCPQDYYNLSPSRVSRQPDEKEVRGIIRALDQQSRWLVKHAMISNPYAGDGQKQDPVTTYATTNVGDETDTSPFRDTSDQLYLSTGEFIRNMSWLIRFLQNQPDR